MFSKALGPLLLMTTAACYSWRPQAPTPNAGAPDSASGIIRATLVDGSRIEVYDAVIVNDTLQGLDLRRLGYGLRVPVAIPVSEISSVQTRHVNTGKTIAMVLAVVVPVGLFVSFIVTMSNLGPI